jgi:hypothetical protein
MLVVGGMLFVGVVVVAVVLMLALRSWMLDEAQTEAGVRSPKAHRVAYVVPVGQDPAVLRAALTHAGFTTALDTERGDERLLVACDEQARVQVRSIIEHVDRAGADGPDLQVGRVTFEDEH